MNRPQARSKAWAALPLVTLLVLSTVLLIALHRSGDGADTSAAAGPGAVIAVEPGETQWMAQVPAGSRVVRMVYGSTSGLTGEATEVSGALFVPAGPAPAGGWPLIVNAHGTTGITRDCAPSDTEHLYGATVAVDRFLRQGYAVVAPDYQGLGTDTEASPPHPYLEPKTVGYNVIDAARAAQAADDRIGNRWVAVGISQGGAAVWAAAEEFAGYGAGSGDMLGASAVVPVLDPVDIVEQAQAGTLSHSQKYVYPILVAGVAQADPAIDVDDYLHGSVDAALPRIVSCSPDQWVAGSEIEAAPVSEFTASPEATARLVDHLQSYRLPRHTTPVPILAVYGTTDEIIAVPAVEGALAKACTLGITVERVRLEGQDHNLNPGPIQDDWIADRFAGRPASTDCPTPG